MKNREKISVYSIKTEGMELENKREEKMVSFLAYCLLKNHFYPVEIWSRFLQQKLLGVNYKRTLNRLEEKQILQIFPSYSNALHFCKKYSFTKKFKRELRDGRLKWNQLGIWQPRETIWEDEEPTSDSYLQKIKDFYQEQVRVLPTFTELFSILSCRDKIFSSGFLKERERMRVLRVSRGRCGRVYHPVICMSKALRPYVTIKKEPLLVYDIALCHPTFMQLLAGEDREQYIKEWLNGTDYYSKFGDDREEIKIIYEKAITQTTEMDCNATSIKGSIRSSLFSYPHLRDGLQYLWGKGISTQAFFQKIESELIIKTLEENPDLEILPMHDGVAGRIGNKKQLEEFVDLCKQKSKKLYDMDVNFRSHLVH